MKKYILPIITLIISILTIIYILKLNVIPNKYLIIILLTELILFILSLLQIKKNKVLKVIGITLSILLIIINILGINYINKANKFIDQNFTGDIVYNSDYYIITSPSTNKEIDKLLYYKYSYNIEEAKEHLNYNLEEIDNLENIKDLKNKFLLIDEYNLKLLKLEYKVLEQFNIKKIEQRKTEKLDSYNIYIGGRDFTRTLMDFNMILTINNNTKTILITNIPRDYYINIPEYNTSDSLEFMGLLGEQTIMSSLEQLLDTKIDYYASIYTEGLVQITDLLGGIDYCSDMTFTTTHALVQDTYEDYGEKLTIYEGCQHLNGIQTLTLARERKNVGSDRQRQKNCTKIIRSLLDKALTTTTLSNYEELLSEISNLYQTNINKETIKSLIKNLINEKYTIIEQSLDGYDGNDYIRLNSVKSYVMYPNYDTVNEAKQKINQTLKGE